MSGRVVSCTQEMTLVTKIYAIWSARTSTVMKNQMIVNLVRIVSAQISNHYGLWVGLNQKLAKKFSYKILTSKFEVTIYINYKYEKRFYLYFQPLASSFQVYNFIHLYRVTQLVLNTDYCILWDMTLITPRSRFNLPLNHIYVQTKLINLYHTFTALVSPQYPASPGGAAIRALEMLFFSSLFR